MTPASLITLFRLVLIPFFLMAVSFGAIRAAFWIFVASGISDLLDGLVARYFCQRTVLGAILDPMADKLVLTSAYVVLAIPSSGLAHPMPVWLPVLTISRDVILVLMSVILHMTHDLRRFPPSWPGKTHTFFQVSLAVAVLLRNAYGLPAPVVNGLVVAVATTTVWSGFHYFWRTRHLVPEEP